MRPGSAASARAAAAEAAVGPHVDPGVSVGVGWMNDEAAVLGLGGGNMVGREADSETAGSGIMLEALILTERLSLLLARRVDGSSGG